MIALTYQLEKELIGIEHLRNQPIVPKTIASKNIPTELLDRTPVAGFYIPPNENQLKEKTDSVNKILQSIDENKQNDNELDLVTDELIEELEKLDCDSKTYINYDNESDNILVPVIDNIEKSNSEVDNQSNENDISSGDDDGDVDDSDDDSSWITPSNIAEIKSSYGKDLSENIEVRVACMSTDYAIQNVLKQMNLNIVAIDGKVIK